jgi:hypothetical protein
VPIGSTRSGENNHISSKAHRTCLETISICKWGLVKSNIILWMQTLIQIELHNSNSTQKKRRKHTTPQMCTFRRQQRRWRHAWVIGTIDYKTMMMMDFTIISWKHFKCLSTGRSRNASNHEAAVRTLTNSVGTFALCRVSKGHTLTHSIRSHPTTIIWKPNVTTD